MGDPEDAWGVEVIVDVEDVEDVEVVEGDEVDLGV